MLVSTKNNTHSIVRAFGGVKAVAEKFNISNLAVYSWIDKDHIPPARKLVLIKEKPNLFDTQEPKSASVEAISMPHFNMVQNYAMELAINALHQRVSALEALLNSNQCAPTNTHVQDEGATCGAQATPANPNDETQSPVSD